MLLFILFLLLVWTLALQATSSDFASPAVAIPMSFFACGVFSVYNSVAHRITPSVESRVIISAMTAMMSLVCCMLSVAFRKRRINSISLCKAAVIRTPLVLDLATIVFSLGVLFLIVRDMQKTVAYFSSDWSSGIYAYRMSGYSSGDYGALGVSQPVGAMAHVQAGIALAMAYVGINNLVCGGGRVRGFFQLIPILINATYGLVTSSRFDSIRNLLTLFILYWLLLGKLRRWPVQVSIARILRVTAVATMLLLAFWSVGEFVGRNIDNDPLDYIASYLGYSYKLFGMFIKEPINPNQLFGSETLQGLYSSVGRFFGLKGLVSSVHHEFRFVDGICLGNVYTAYRMWLHDFGTVGMFISGFLYSLVLSVWYERAARCTTSSPIQLSTLFYSYLAYGSFLFPINECILHSILVFSVPFELAIAAALSHFICSYQRVADKRVVGSSLEALRMEVR